VIVRADRFQLAAIEGPAALDTAKAFAVTLDVVLVEHRIAVVTPHWSHH
jgi:hypothetical protein